MQKPGPRWAGLGWLVVGLAAYIAYRRFVIREPVTATLRAPVIIGPGAALEYRRILVPVKPGRASEEAIDAYRRAGVVYAAKGHVVGERDIRERLARLDATAQSP